MHKSILFSLHVFVYTEIQSEKKKKTQTVFYMQHKQLNGKANCINKQITRKKKRTKKTTALNLKSFEKPLSVVVYVSH